jgi:hypothetical protein
MNFCRLSLIRPFLVHSNHTKYTKCSKRFICKRVPFPGFLREDLQTKEMWVAYVLDELQYSRNNKWIEYIPPKFRSVLVSACATYQTTSIFEQVSPKIPTFVLENPQFWIKLIREQYHIGYVRQIPSDICQELLINEVLHTYLATRLSRYPPGSRYYPKEIESFRNLLLIGSIQGSEIGYLKYINQIYFETDFNTVIYSYHFLKMYIMSWLKNNANIHFDQDTILFPADYRIRSESLTDTLDRICEFHLAFEQHVPPEIKFKCEQMMIRMLVETEGQLHTGNCKIRREFQYMSSTIKAITLAKLKKANFEDLIGFSLTSDEFNTLNISSKGYIVLYTHKPCESGEIKISMIGSVPDNRLLNPFDNQDHGIPLICMNQYDQFEVFNQDCEHYRDGRPYTYIINQPLKSRMIKFSSATKLNVTDIKF